MKCEKMNRSILNTSDIPPPPPPPSTSSKRFSKTMIAAILVIVLVVAVSAGAYYAMTLPHDNNPGPEPSPTATPSTSDQTSPSPTSTPLVTATPTPSGTASVGYRNGAWANYTTNNYNSNGAVTATYDLGYSVSQGPINGVDCWILQTELKLSIGSDVTKTVTTYWLDKSNLQGLHYKIVISSNGVVISDTENDYAPGDVNNIPTTINPNMVLSKESVTVPAGTFNCDKAAITQTDLGKTYVTTTWGNSNIPVVGMVKQTMTQDGVLISTTELTAYGG
jgi:hypothetical protein